MYARVQTCEHMLQEDVLDKRPIILCEYSHAMGNSNGSADLYWECFRREGPIQGGFVWDWVDQGLDAVAPNGRLTGRMAVILVTFQMMLNSALMVLFSQTGLRILLCKSSNT